MLRYRRHVFSCSVGTLVLIVIDVHSDDGDAVDVRLDVESVRSVGERMGTSVAAG